MAAVGVATAIQRLMAVPMARGFQAAVAAVGVATQDAGMCRHPTGAVFSGGSGRSRSSYRDVSHTKSGMGVVFRRQWPQ